MKRPQTENKQISEFNPDIPSLPNSIMTGELPKHLPAASDLMRFARCCSTLWHNPNVQKVIKNIKKNTIINIIISEYAIFVHLADGSVYAKKPQATQTTETFQRIFPNKKITQILLGGYLSNDRDMPRVPRFLDEENYYFFIKPDFLDLKTRKLEKSVQKFWFFHDSYTVFFYKDGTVYLGVPTGHRLDITLPKEQKIKELLPYILYSAVDGHNKFAVLILTEHAVYALGYNHGQLGIGRDFKLHEIILKPQKVLLPEGTRVRQIHAKDCYTIFLCEEGLYLTGQLVYGHDKDPAYKHPVPEKIDLVFTNGAIIEPSDLLQIMIGLDYGLALTKKGEILTFPLAFKSSDPKITVNVTNIIQEAPKKIFQGENIIERFNHTDFFLFEGQKGNIYKFTVESLYKGSFLKENQKIIFNLTDPVLIISAEEITNALNIPKTLDQNKDPALNQDESEYSSLTL